MKNFGSLGLNGIVVSVNGVANKQLQTAYEENRIIGIPGVENICRPTNET